MPIHSDVHAYNQSQSPDDQRICDALAKVIDQHLPGAENKIWHRHPVWFLGGNPIVGYSKLKDCIRLLFWSGQSFDEPGLAPEGSFKAAEARYTSDDQIVAKDLKRWLKKAIEIQWDYKNIVKRKGKLELLTGAPVVHATSVAKKPFEDREAGMKKAKSRTEELTAEISPSQEIDARIHELTDWRGETLARVRKLIKQADPEVVEEVKWRKPSNGMAGVPVWEHDGIICTGETYKSVVKLTFPKGASLEDPAGLFNSSLEGNARRAIDMREGEKINDKALKALICAAVALNCSGPAVSVAIAKRTKKA